MGVSFAKYLSSIFSFSTTRGSALDTEYRRIGLRRSYCKHITTLKSDSCEAWPGSICFSFGGHAVEDCCCGACPVLYCPVLYDNPGMEAGMAGRRALEGAEKVGGLVDMSAQPGKQPSQYQTVMCLGRDRPAHTVN